MVSKTRRNQGSFPSGCPKYSKIKLKKNKSRQLYLVIGCNLFTPKSLKLIFLANGTFLCYLVLSQEYFPSQQSSQFILIACQFTMY